MTATCAIAGCPALPAGTWLAGNLRLGAHCTVGRGVRFEAEPHLVAKLPDHDLWLAFFQDSEGNFLALMSEVAH